MILYVICAWSQLDPSNSLEQCPSLRCLKYAKPAKSNWDSPDVTLPPQIWRRETLLLSYTIHTFLFDEISRDTYIYINTLHFIMFESSPRHLILVILSLRDDAPKRSLITAQLPTVTDVKQGQWTGDIVLVYGSVITGDSSPYTNLLRTTVFAYQESIVVTLSHLPPLPLAMRKCMDRSWFWSVAAYLDLWSRHHKTTVLL